MSIEKKLYGNFENQDIFAYILDNKNGLQAEILSCGGVIRKLIFDGVDVALAHDDIKECMFGDENFGGLIGRNSNRIGGASFKLNGKTYNLAKNNGEANLHSGPIGFNNRIWKVEEVDGKEPALVLTYTSPDGEMGFPGEAKVKVTYTLTSENSIKIHYEGVCDSDSILNMTNHAYFNLNGHSNGTVDNHILELNSSFYTPNTPECLPYGVVESVENTPFDFRCGKKLKDVFASDFEQMTLFGGVDHNFALDGFGFRYCGKLTGDESGISMELFTDRPAVQVYTGNFIHEDKACKAGIKYKKHGGMCLETQVFPNFTSYSHFPGGFIKKGEKYETITEYRFKRKEK